MDPNIPTTPPQSPPGAPAQPPPRGHGLRVAGLVIAILAFLIGWFPFAGFAGLLGIGLALAGYAKAEGDPRRRFPVGTLILGLLSTSAAVVWSVLIASGSCPHVYAHDGREWRLDGDMLSGSFFAAAEGEDLVRLEHAAAPGGEYRVRIANERQERDFVDSVELMTIDHPRDTTALPTPDGAIVVAGPQLAPISARDAQGRDELAAVVARDARAWRGRSEGHDAAAPAEPRDVLELALPRPSAGGGALLVLRARNTQLATDALYRYLARMGPGLTTLLHWAEQGESYPYRARIADEIERLGVPLRVEVLGSSGWQPAQVVRAVGPAVPRSFAVALPADLPDPVRVRLVAAPLFWEVDGVAIAAQVAGGEPSRAVLSRGVRAADDVAPELASTDGRRLLVRSGESVELSFAAEPPAADGAVRSVFLKMRGYYEVDIGGRGWLDPIALWRHRSGRDSLPRFVLREANGG